MTDEEFVAQVFAASLSLMSILIAVIAILAVEYKRVESDPALATPLWYMIIGTTLAVILAGLAGLSSLIYLRVHWGTLGFFYRLFIYGFSVLLIVMVTIGTPVVVWQLF